MRDRTRVDVSGTGSANAETGGIANSGYIGSISVVHAGPIVRSAYLEQVRRLAPVQLAGRDEELAELGGFCTEPDRGAYSWWQAGAWAGKSALMSWFVLHPPPGVRVVSFFITARFAGQSNRDAFTDAVLEQLADLLGEPMPAYLTEATRDAHLLDMLTRAARSCHADGQRLVLVIDGLDEDLGWTTSLDAHSIAALLPAAPPAGARIIVAGRPNPPVPADVPGNHPLRDPQVFRPLAPSPHAAVIEHDARREIKRLVEGTEAELDLLGVLAAAAGGLSGPDLAELTGLPAWQIEENLHTVSGRTFRREVSQWQPGAVPEVYLLGHDELRQLAVTYIGTTRLQDCLRRLHAWADAYRQRGWPPDTPEYLLRDYYRLLNDTGDLGRVIACATDPARHDRMLDLTGGDSAALSEITTAQQAILQLPEPDLLAMACLALHRDDLGQRNASIPSGLPTVWALLGRTDRAQALAGSITDLGRRGEALADLALAAAAAGDQSSAIILAERAEETAAHVSDLDWLAWVYASASKALAAAGDLGRARALASRTRTMVDQKARRSGLRLVQIRGMYGKAAATAWPTPERAWAVTALVEAMAGAGDDVRMDVRADSSTLRRSPWEVLIALTEVIRTAADREAARILAGWGEDAITLIRSPDEQALALAALAKAMAASGNLAEARLIADRADAVVRAVSDERWNLTTVSGEVIVYVEKKVRALGAVAEALAASGDADRARLLADLAAVTMTGSGTDDFDHSRVLTALAKAVAAVGDLDRAQALAGSVTDSHLHAQVLTALVTSAAAAGDLDRARSLAELAQVMASSITDELDKAEALTALAKGVAAAGDLDQALAIAQAIADPKGQAQALTDLANAMVACGDLDRADSLTVRAQALAGSITDPERQARMLTVVVRALTSSGDLDRARKMASRAQAAAGAITSAGSRADALADVAKALAAAGDTDRARAVARCITDPDSQARALAEVAKALAAAGDLDQALTIARFITDEFEQAEAFRAMVDAAVEAQNLDRAALFAVSIREKIQQAWALKHVVNALMTAANLERAETLAGHITWAPVKVEVLCAVAKAIAAAGELDRARILFDQAQKLACSTGIIDLFWQAKAFASLIESTAAVKDWGRTRRLIHGAERVANSNSRLDKRAEALGELAVVLAATGYTRRADDVLDQAETAAGQIDGSDGREKALAQVAQAAAVSGNYDRAMSIANTIDEPNKHASALGQVAKATAAAGDLHQALALAHSINEPHSQAQALAAVAQVLIAAGELDLAQDATLSIAIRDQQTEPLVALTNAVIATGDLSRARSVAHRIASPSQQADALTVLAKALAAAGEPEKAEAEVTSIPDAGRQAKALAAIAAAVPSEQGRLLAARAFQTGDWTVPLDALARVQPDVLAQVADKILS
jgi:tetratricopeptide (TPR) repeat protein